MSPRTDRKSSTPPGLDSRRSQPYQRRLGGEQDQPPTAQIAPIPAYESLAERVPEIARSMPRMLLFDTREYGHTRLPMS